MKKRWNSKGQITIFIIIGLVIMVTLGFFMYLTFGIQKEKVEAAREVVQANSLKKDAVRLMVEDCFEDNLKEGLLLLGRQGGIWRDQGGVKTFDSGLGIEYSGDRVAYLISRQEHANPWTYPCTAGSSCRYEFGASGFIFGKKDFFMSGMERDLGRYIKEKTVVCVQNHTEANFPGQAKLSADGATVRLKFEDRHIDVQGTIPISAELPGGETFSISDFSYSFPSEMKNFLGVVEDVIDYELQYVDYEVDSDVLQHDLVPVASLEKTDRCEGLEKPYTCFINGGGYVGEFEKVSLDSVDVFVFRPVLDELLGFEFRFARENRPPALEDVNRCPGNFNGEDFDYLVVEGVDSLDSIEFTPSAWDPDGDGVSYSVVGTVHLEGEAQVALEDSDRFTFDVAAKDAHGEEDGQEVRVLKAPDDYACRVEVGCFGGDPVEFDFAKQGYVMQVKRFFCAGDGCGGEPRYSMGDEEREGQIICGDPGVSDTCFEEIPTACRGQAARSVTGSGVCYGETGCEFLCDSIFVDRSGDGVYNNERDGCTCIAGDVANGGDDGRKCDSTRDGNFNGVCEAGQCV